MNIGIIHTVGSPCRCAEAIEQGLNALGHKVLIADSEEIVFNAHKLACSCDLIIDHSDTFLKKGYTRFVVRSMLESYGARIVGSNAKACQLADNKSLAKSYLGSVGIPVPPGILVTSDAFNMPKWLKPPYVIKAAFEHMSCGIRIAYSTEEAQAKVASIIKHSQQPVMVESYIEGRELAVSVVDGPDGFKVFPPLEWYPESDDVFLAEKLKLVEFSTKNRPDAQRADLSPSATQELEGFARLAFYTLGLCDYARFDIRLSPEGTFFFLETNVTPSLEPFEAFCVSAKWAGKNYPELIDMMLTSAAKRYEQGCSLENRGQKTEDRRRISLRDLPEARKAHRPIYDLCFSDAGLANHDGSAFEYMRVGDIDIYIPKGVHPPFPSSIELTKCLDIKAGENVLDLGCGSGVLSIAAAKLGAGSVVAVDIDPLSLETTMYNAQKNGVADIVKVYAGFWYEALQGKLAADYRKKFDVIIATPPQTPSPEPFSPRYGGVDGTLHLLKIIDGASNYLDYSNGRFWLLVISLANPSGVLVRLKETFQKVEIIKETDRPFTADEYNSRKDGLMEYLLKLRKSGKSEFTETTGGNYVFRNLFMCASKPR